MRCLLDTHTFVWAVQQPTLLSHTATQLLENPATQVFISAVSVWEMSLKHQLGKWREVAAFMDDDLYTNFLLRLNATELEISSRHARLAGQFSTAHKDPFDRLLAAQAILEGMPIISKDPLLESFGVTRVW